MEMHYFCIVDQVNIKLFDVSGTQAPRTWADYYTKPHSRCYHIKMNGDVHHNSLTLQYLQQAFPPVVWQWCVETVPPDIATKYRANCTA